MRGRYATRPLLELVRVARAIGDGDLDRRMVLRRPRSAELTMLAGAVNDMAERLTEQVRDQRELLAAVSHELRTPLGHLRILSEMLRDRDGGARTDADADADTSLVHEIDREIAEIDALVDQLLASSRLDFAAVERRPVDVVTLAARALERAAVPEERLLVEIAAPEARVVAIDAALIARALANLVRNAETHGRGLIALRVSTDAAGALAISVDDEGPGFADADRDRIFAGFYRGEHRAGATGLGLGLSLVRRIAEAHGGRAWAEPRPGGGARVGFTITA